MSHSIAAIGIIATVLIAPAVAQTKAASRRGQTKPQKEVTLFLEGDSSTLPKFINVCREKGPEYGLNFRFVDKKDDVFDYRVVQSSEGSGLWNYAHGNI